MHSFLTPPPLRAGDRVRVIATGGAVPREAFEEGLALLEAQGLVPVWDEALLGRDMYFAGSHNRRQQELLGALADPDSKAIWAARGGCGTARLLAPLDAALLRAHPKWLVGFSDLTGLHAAYQKAHMVSLHGANVTTLASWSADARRALFELLFEGATSPKVPPSGARWAERYLGDDACPAARRFVGPARGRLWGGNLTVLASLCGTGQLPEAALGGPSILLLEEIGEAPYRLDRCWHQLEASGVLGHVAGVALGQLTRCEVKDVDYTAHQMLTRAIEAAELPWVSGLPFGHAETAWAVPLGAEAHLDVAGRALTVHL